MKAAVVNEIGGGFHVEDIEVGEPRGSEVLVEVKAAGLCHTDLTYATTDIGLPPPVVLGHESAGIVAAVGPDVADLEVGDHVTGCLIQSCGQCRNCLSGFSYRCLHPERMLRAEGDAPRLSRGGRPVTQGFGLGGFAEQALIHENQLVKVPDEVPFPQAALLGCGVVTGAGAVLNTADVQAGDSVVVLGVGGVGLNSVSGAVIAGASRIIAIDLADEKLETARSFGATHTINSSTTDPVTAVREVTGGGADHVFDFVGLEDVTGQALEMLTPGGGLYLVGMAKAQVTLSLDLLSTIGGQRRVEGVYMGSSNVARDIPMYCELYLDGRMNLDGLVSHCPRSMPATSPSRTPRPPAWWSRASDDASPDRQSSLASSDSTRRRRSVACMEMTRQTSS